MGEIRDADLRQEVAKRFLTDFGLGLDRKWVSADVQNVFGLGLGWEWLAKRFFHRFLLGDAKIDWKRPQNVLRSFFTEY